MLVGICPLVQPDPGAVVPFEAGILRRRMSGAFRQPINEKARFDRRATDGLDNPKSVLCRACTARIPAVRTKDARDPSTSAQRCFVPGIEHTTLTVAVPRRWVVETEPKKEVDVEPVPICIDLFEAMARGRKQSPKDYIR